MNTLYSLLHIVAAMIFLALTFGVLVKDRASPLNRVCAALLACFFIWSLAYSQVHFPYMNRSRVMLFENIASVGWIFFGFFFIWFSWLYTRMSRFRGFPAVVSVLLLVPCVLLYMQWIHNGLIDQHVKLPYGWYGLWSASFWPYLFFAYYWSTVSTGLFLICRYQRASSSHLIKHQSKILIVSAVIPLFLGTLANVILPNIGFLSIPSIADIIILIWASGLVYAVSKYRLLSLTPIMAAERIIAAMSDFLFLLDPQGRIISTNPATCNTLEYAAEDLEGRPFSQVLSGSDEDREHLAGIIKSKPWNGFETIMSTRTGRPVFVSLTTSLIPSTGIVCVAHDSTLQKERTDKLRETRDRLEHEIFLAADDLQRSTRQTQQLKLELHHAQKMEAIGRLAGGIAHDFNNLLGGIIGYADFLRMKCVSQMPSQVQTAQKIMDIAKQASAITSQLLAFARKGKYHVVTLDLHDCIHDTIALLRHSIDRKTTVVTRLDATASTVIGDKSQIMNALVNLGVNARDAMTQGGTLTLETALVEIGEDLARSYPYNVEPGAFIRLTVTDTGEGMDDETRTRAFEPFFTTKGPGKGTGLGLASVYGTVKNHHGFVELRSDIGKGTTITVFLPLATHSPLRQEADSPITYEKYSGTIMVVDDEAINREMASDSLAMLGYNVSAYANGSDAIAAYRKRPETFDLILLDLTMPGMSGAECLNRLKEINPMQKVIITTGDTTDSDITDLLNKKGVLLMQKPFDLNSLSQKVSSLLKTH